MEKSYDVEKIFVATQDKGSKAKTGKSAEAKKFFASVLSFLETPEASKVKVYKNGTLVLFTGDLETGDLTDRLIAGTEVFKDENGKLPKSAKNHAHGILGKWFEQADFINTFGQKWEVIKVKGSSNILRLKKVAKAAK